MSFFEISLSGFFIRFAELLGGAFKEPSMLWFGLPLLASMIIIELNTGSVKKSFFHDTHEVKQAFPHSIVLFFVALDLFRMTFDAKTGFSGTVFSGMFLGALVVLLLAKFVFLFDYYLEFPRKTYFGLTLHLPINILAYAIMVATYIGTGFDINSILAMIAFGFLVGILIFLVKKIEPDNSKKSDKRARSRNDGFDSDDYSPRRKSSEIFDDDYKPKKQSHKIKSASNSQDLESDTVDLNKGNLTWFKK